MIHPPVDGRLGGVCLPAGVTGAAVNTHEVGVWRLCSFLLGTHLAVELLGLAELSAVAAPCVAPSGGFSFSAPSPTLTVVITAF